MDQFKKCSKCEQVKKITEFYMCSGVYRPECKVCNRIINKLRGKKVENWKDPNRKQYMRDYYKDNPDKFSEYRKKYRLANPEYYKRYFEEQRNKKPVQKDGPNIRPMEDTDD